MAWSEADIPDHWKDGRRHRRQQRHRPRDRARARGEGRARDRRLPQRGEGPRRRAPHPCGGSRRRRAFRAARPRLARIGARLRRQLGAAESRIDLLVNNAGVMCRRTARPPTASSCRSAPTTSATSHSRASCFRAFSPRRRRASSASAASPTSGAASTSPISSPALLQPDAQLRTEQAREPAVRAGAAAPLRGKRADALAAAAHPGSTRTELQRHSGMMNAIVAVFSQQPPEGALRASTPPPHPTARRRLLRPERLRGLHRPARPARSSAASRDVAVAKRLWDVSEQLTGVRFAL